MKTFSRKDFWYSLITGGYTGLIAWLIADFLHAKIPGGIPGAALIVIVPVAWIAGINLGYFLGRYLAFFSQFGKFAAIGFTNFAVDLAVLNLLIAGTSINKGLWYTVFTVISFSVAALHSYFWNHSWVFSGSSQGGAGEFTKFLAVTVLAVIVSSACASLIVNILGPHFGLSADAWANFGKVVGSAVALVVSFVGYRLAVFKT